MCTYIRILCILYVHYKYTYKHMYSTTIATQKEPSGDPADRQYTKLKMQEIVDDSYMKLNRQPQDLEQLNECARDELE